MMTCSSLVSQLIRLNRVQNDVRPEVLECCKIVMMMLVNFTTTGTYTRKATVTREQGTMPFTKVGASRGVHWSGAAHSVH
jgi:hypothetical protein